MNKVLGFVQLDYLLDENTVIETYINPKYIISVESVLVNRKTEKGVLISIETYKHPIQVFNKSYEEILKRINTAMGEILK